MKIIYVASSYAGDIQKNTEFAKIACHHVMEQGHAFFCPHLLYPNILNEHNPKERQLGLDMGLAMLKSCDELWVFGKHISQGMSMEIERAKELKMPIVYQELDVVQNVITSFNPKNFEVKSKVYGNTGGNCMVGTIQFYLPDLDRILWVNCNDESASITTADYMWNTDGSESWDCYEDVLVASFSFDDSPEQWSQWLPMVHETLLYTIEQETAYFKKPFSLPVAWLPDTIRKNAEPGYLEWLQSEGKNAEIEAQGRIVIDEAYPCSEHTLSGIGTMGYQ